MFARTVSIHLKSNMLSDYNRTFEKDILPLLRNRRALGTRSHCQIPAAQMRSQSVCGRPGPMQMLTTPVPTPKF